MFFFHCASKKREISDESALNAVWCKYKTGITACYLINFFFNRSPSRHHDITTQFADRYNSISVFSAALTESHYSRCYCQSGCFSLSKRCRSKLDASGRTRTPLPMTGIRDGDLRREGKIRSPSVSTTIRVGAFVPIPLCLPSLFFEGDR